MAFKNEVCLFMLYFLCTENSWHSVMYWDGFFYVIYKMKNQRRFDSTCFPQTPPPLLSSQRGHTPRDFPLFVEAGTLLSDPVSVSFLSLQAAHPPSASTTTKQPGSCKSRHASFLTCWIFHCVCLKFSIAISAYISIYQCNVTNALLYLSWLVLIMH